MHAKNCGRFVCLALGWAALLVGPSRSEAGTIYTYTGLGTLPGDDGARPLGINSSGDVVGISEVKSGGDADYPPGSKPDNDQAFLYHDGTMTGLGIRGNATAINDSGVIVGNDSSTGKNYVYAYGVETPLPGAAPGSAATIGINNAGQILTPGSGGEIINPDGTVKAIADTPSTPATVPFSINGSGQVVGFMVPPGTGEIHPFLYSNGTVTDLSAKINGGGSDPVLARQSIAISINNAGQMIVEPELSRLPVIYDTKTGTVTNIPTLPGTSLTTALNVVMNNLGQVAATSTNSPSSYHLFLDSGGVLQDLTSVIPDSANWHFLNVTGINDSGQIIGYGIDPSGKDVAFLLSPEPVPEPTTLACWGLAALGFAIRARGRRGR